MSAGSRSAAELAVAGRRGARSPQTGSAHLARGGRFYRTGRTGGTGRAGRASRTGRTGGTGRLRSGEHGLVEQPGDSCGAVAPRLDRLPGFIGKEREVMRQGEQATYLGQGTERKRKMASATIRVRMDTPSPEKRMRHRNAATFPPCRYSPSPASSTPPRSPYVALRCCPALPGARQGCAGLRMAHVSHSASI